MKMTTKEFGDLSKLATLATLALSVALSTSAFAAENDPVAAKTHYAAGLRHFNLSEYEQSLTEFKDAYRNKSDPVFLYNIGQCHRKLGHIEEAITFYRNYLRESPGAKNRNEVERRIEELETLRNAQTLSKTSTLGPALHPSPISQAAQERAVAETAATSSAAGVDVSIGEQPTAPSARPVYKRWWFWTATGAVVVGAAAVAIVMARRDPTSVPGSTLGAQRAMP